MLCKCSFPNQLTHNKLIYVHFAVSKKTYIFRKMKKKRKLRADCVCSGIYIHNPILSTNLVVIRETGVSYCIKELCNLSLEIQVPFTHSLMHAHLPDNRKSLTSHSKHFVECVRVDMLFCI